MKHLRLFILAALIGGFLVFAQTIADRVAATVNGEVITLSDIQWLIRFQRIPLPADPAEREEIRKEIVNQLVDQKLIAAEALATPGITVTEEDVERRLSGYRDQFGSEEAFQQRLAEMEMTIDDLKELIHRQLAVLAFVKFRFEPFIIVLPTQIQDYYDNQLTPELSKSGQSPPPLQLVEEQIRQILTVKRTTEEVDNWVESARQKSNVEILLYDRPRLSPNLPPDFEGNPELRPIRPQDKSRPPS